MDEIKLKIGTSIKIGRERKGWTQKKLAEFLNVDPSLISRWEKGEKVPMADDLVKIATTLEIVPLLFPELFPNYPQTQQQTLDIAKEISKLWESINRMEARFSKVEPPSKS